jgi:hypothetical protein
MKGRGSFRDLGMNGRMAWYGIFTYGLGTLALKRLI